MTVVSQMAAQGTLRFNVGITVVADPPQPCFGAAEAEAEVLAAASSAVVAEEAVE